jgi:hypothetical protein
VHNDRAIDFGFKIETWDSRSMYHNFGFKIESTLKGSTGKQEHIMRLILPQKKN